MYMTFMILVTSFGIHKIHPTKVGSAIKVITCENRNLAVDCPRGIIRIIYANFGRTSAAECRASSTIDCISTSSLQKVKDECENKRTCSIDARRNVFGEPCLGIPKYLEVHYYCMEVGNYATIFVQGQGKDDPFFDSSGSISGCLLEVNGAKVAPKFRGLHFAIYDYPSLSFKEARGFDPYSSSSETSAMISFIDSLQPGTMVLFCSRDTVDRKPPYQRMTTNAWNKIEELGLKRPAHDSSRASYAMIGFKGQEPPENITRSQSFGRGQGPSIVSLAFNSADGGWSEWNQWSNCDVHESRISKRSCDSPLPKYGGKCNGSHIETIGCPRAQLQVISPRMFFTSLDFLCKALVNHSLKPPLSVQRMTDCMSLCQGEVHCHSFNIESHDHLDERLCELNNSSTAMHPFDLKERPGFLYYEEM